MSPKRASRKQFEARLIQLLKRRFEKSKLKVFDHVKVGKLPLEIDVVAVSPGQGWKPDFTKFPALFSYFRRYNLMEVKTERDNLKMEDLPKLFAYAWLYVAKKRLPNVHNVTVTALVHHLTPGVEKALRGFSFEPLAKGIYRRDADMPAYVISFTEVPDESLPEELRAFSDPARRLQVFLASLRNKEKAPITETILDLYESEVKQIMLNIREKSLKNILSVVATEKIISALGDKKIIAALGDKKIIAALDKRKLRAALSKEDHLAALSREDMIAALGGEKNLLKSLQATSKPQQLPKNGRGKSRN